MSNGSYSSGASMEEDYIEHARGMHKAPSVITNRPDYSNFHKGHQKKVCFVNQQKHHDHPERKKKVVHFSVEEYSVEIVRDGKWGVHNEQTIDGEADGYIMRKHNNFGSSK